MLAKRNATRKYIRYMIFRKGLRGVPQIAYLNISGMRKRTTKDAKTILRQNSQVNCWRRNIRRHNLLHRAGWVPPVANGKERSFLLLHHQEDSRSAHKRIRLPMRRHKPLLRKAAKWEPYERDAADGTSSCIVTTHALKALPNNVRERQMDCVWEVC